MRIRKNKKMSEMGYEGLHSVYDCRLNQSPWDAISFCQEEIFPSSLNLFESSDNSDKNWLYAVCVSASLEMSEGGKEMAAGGVSDKRTERRESETETGKEGNNSDKKKCMRCQKIDNCCCCLNFSICSDNKHEKRVRRSFLAIKRRAREANKLRSGTNGLYYYSGFGPSWSNKR